jgi:NACHT domain/Restriction endonuclease
MLPKKTTRDFPPWLRTEAQVRALFTLLGFEVEQIAIEGRQIDLIATKHDTFSFAPESWTVEITTSYVGEPKGSSDAQKLLLARTRNKATKLLLISTSGFTDDQKSTLRALDIHSVTLTELEHNFINLRRYASNSLLRLTSQRSPDVGYDSNRYIDPEIDVRIEDHKTLSGRDWIDQLFASEHPSVCAVLGDLGSGKTSLLERALQIGCSQFLDDTNNRPIPVFIPLGRYKQHSGDIDQMLMAEFRRVGQHTFPVELVRHLIATKRIILLLDGLDEIHPIQNSDDVLATVSRLLHSIGREAVAVISSRRQFFESTAEELAYFGAYTSVKLKDVQAGLAQKLAGHPTTHIALLRPFDRGRIDVYLEKRCGMSKKETASFFEKFYGFEDMAQTPVLLSMMATAVEEDLLDPRENEQFPLLTLYRSYIKRWIDRDIGRAQLNSQQRWELSEALADHMLWSGRESESWSYISEVLRRQELWQQNPLSDEEADFDIRNSGFLIRDMDDEYRFIHRSIMEFFASVKELGRLRNFERPRHFPTDGFRLFLSQLIADAWLKENEAPLPLVPQGRGGFALNPQMSMLAAASTMIPEDRRVRLKGIGLVETEGDQQWRRVKFEGFQWRHYGADVRFEMCEFANCSIRLEGFQQRGFEECEFSQSEIHFAQTPDWGYLVWDAKSRAERPLWVQQLAELKSAGARVYVEDKEWTLSSLQLFMCSELVSRMRGKVSGDSLFGGVFAEELRGLLPVLIRRGWVREDTSRRPHQFELSTRAREILGGLSRDPLTVQREFAVFRPVSR